MKRNLVIGYCANYAFEVIEPFVASFIRCCVSAELCLFAAGMDARFHEEAERLGIRVEDPSPFLPPGLNIMNARFFMYRSFLNEHAGRYDNILLTDIRDVIFQSDPFGVARDAQVYFAAEDAPIRPDPYNSRWLKELYGDAVFEEIADHPISCAGTTIGTYEGISAYIAYMCFTFETGNFAKHVNYDQGIHNFIVWKVKPEFGKIDLDDRIVSTIGLTNASRIRIVDDVVLVDGIAAPVVHQWDRKSAIVVMVADSPKFKLAEPGLMPGHGDVESRQPDDGAEGGRWTPSVPGKAGVPATKEEDGKAFFGLFADPNGDIRTLLSGYLDYHGGLNFGQIGMVYDRLKKSFQSGTGTAFAARQRLDIVGGDSRVNQEILQELLPARADAYFKEGDPGVLTATRIFERTPNEYASESLPRNFNQRLRLKERPGLDIWTANGRNLFLGPYGYTYFDRAERCFWPIGSSRSFTSSVADYPGCSARRPVVVVQDQFDTGNFAHFLYDSVPRIIYFIKAFPERAKSALFVLGGKQTEYHRIILASIAKSYGLDSFNFFFPTERMVLEISENVYFFSDQRQTIMHPLHMCAPATVSMVRGLLGEIGIARGTPPKLYISRRDASMRKIKNEDALIQNLARAGYREITLANLTARDQIALLANAKRVIGPHGMGLTNIVFNNDGERLTELFNPENGSDAYAFVATAIGLKYEFQIGQPVAGTWTLEYEMDIEQIMTAL